LDGGTADVGATDMPATLVVFLKMKTRVSFSCALRLKRRHARTHYDITNLVPRILMFATTPSSPHAKLKE
jgi:hypothetical protein